MPNPKPEVPGFDFGIFCPKKVGKHIRKALVWQINVTIKKVVLIVNKCSSVVLPNTVGYITLNWNFLLFGSII